MEGSTDLKSQQHPDDEEPQQQQEALTDLNIGEVMDEFARDQLHNLDEKEFLKIAAKEDMMPPENLSHVENPVDLYPNIKSFLDVKIKAGVENFSSARAITKVNTFVTTRLNKIVIGCVRHYNNNDILEEQQDAMTPQELEFSIKITTAIRDFRQVIYKD